MAGKKTRIWRLAGEQVSPTTLTFDEERLFLSRFSRLQKKFANEKDSPIGVTPTLARARENAARLSAPFFLANCKGGREDVLDTLACAVSLPVRLLEWFGEPDFLMMGAACWFLDYVHSNNKVKQFLSLLPPFSDIDDLDLPNVEDLTWPREVFVRTVILLQNRKSTYAKQFRRLLKLIRKEDAAALRVLFRDAALDYFRRFYEIQTRVKPAPRQEPETSFPLAPLPAIKNLFNAERKKISPPDIKLHVEETPGIHFLLRAPELLGASADKVQSVMYFRRMTEKLTGFHTPRPYDICAAAVLLEQEDDLLWSLNTLTDTVILCAQRSLPWSLQENFYQKTLSEEAEEDQTPRYLFQPPDEDETAPIGDDIEEGELLSEGQLFYLATGYLLPRNSAPSPVIAAWFEKQGVPAERARELSLYAFLIHHLDNRLYWLEELDDAPETGWKQMEMAEVHARGRDNPRRRNAEGTSDENEEEESGEDAEKEREKDASAEKSAPPRQDIAAAEARAAELSRQLKNAKKALYDSDRTVRQLKEQLSAEQQAAAQNKAELSSLREALFRLKSADQPEEQPPQETIEFPWTGRRRILVFGGHDTWSKVIRPLLPGVRFCDRELLPDLNAIKSADIVWIQPNALSHKFYYRIIETARKENIPVRYFGFASARKCAEQLVETELAAEDT